MIYAGLVAEGIECVGNIRARYDGERRNPWDEAECGSHYARAMAAWSVVLAISGFRYDGPRADDRRAAADQRRQLPLLLVDRHRMGPASPTELTAARSPSRCCTARSHAAPCRWRTRAPRPSALS